MKFNPKYQVLIYSFLINVAAPILLFIGLFYYSKFLRSNKQANPDVFKITVGILVIVFITALFGLYRFLRDCESLFKKK
jgi:hypothetical protein